MVFKTKEHMYVGQALDNITWANIFFKYQSSGYWSLLFRKVVFNRTNECYTITPINCNIHRLNQKFFVWENVLLYNLQNIDTCTALIALFEIYKKKYL